MNVFEIAWLTEEQVALFQSDFRFVADYFVQMRKNRHYVPSEETIQHVDAVLKMMAVLTGNRKFEDAQNRLGNYSVRSAHLLCRPYQKVEFSHASGEFACEASPDG